MIYTRGKPEREDRIHAQEVIVKRGMPTIYRPLCLNGSYHVFLSDFDLEVNCEKCLKRMEGRLS